jgi:hypothetical protein
VINRVRRARGRRDEEQRNQDDQGERYGAHGSDDTLASVRLRSLRPLVGGSFWSQNKRLYDLEKHAFKGSDEGNDEQE